jgi:hypothetical protein
MARKSTFQVFSRYSDAHQGLLDGPNSYWRHPMWSVVFDNGGRPVVSCPYTLVTDDGEFLVLFGEGFHVRDALTIYRRGDHPGQPFGGRSVLVRQIPLSDLWPAERIQHLGTDEAQSWFIGGGTFAFSADNRTLIHKTRWSQTLCISLETGRVTSQ